MVDTHTIRLSTRGHSDMHDITRQVQEAVRASGIQNGLVTVFTPSSTSGITTIEFESGALADLKRLFEQIAPEAAHYEHNLRWGDGNGYAHVRAALLGPSLTIPVSNGALMLGTWQQITFIDFDNRPRRREIIVQVVGEQ